VVLVADLDTTRRRPEERVETTARMDVEELRARLNATKLRTKAHQPRERNEVGAASEGPGPAEAEAPEHAPGVHARLTPATLSSAVDADLERSRKATPLVVVAGGGEPQQEGFEPLENTPLGIGMPEPARLMDDASSGFSVDEQTPVEDPGEGLPEGVEVPGSLHPSSTQTALGAPDEGERVESMLAGARQLLEQGTNEGSLWLCERILTLDPDSAEARDLLERNRAVLQGQYEQQIGDLELVPVVQIPQHEIMWHKLDHRAGFLLSRIDGQLSYGDIIDVSGMGSFEATRILAQLQGMGVIGHRK
jgi:hypothetical protein